MNEITLSFKAQKDTNTSKKESKDKVDTRVEKRKRYKEEDATEGLHKTQHKREKTEDPTKRAPPVADASISLLPPASPVSPQGMCTVFGTVH